MRETGLRRHSGTSNRPGQALPEEPSLQLWCTRCSYPPWTLAQAKSQLDEAGLGYEEINLGSFPKLLTEIKAATGRQSVPQVRHERCSVKSSATSRELYR